MSPETIEVIKQLALNDFVQLIFGGWVIGAFLGITSMAFGKDTPS